MPHTSCLTSPLITHHHTSYFISSYFIHLDLDAQEMDLMRRFIHTGNTVVEAGVHIASLTVAFAQVARLWADKSSI